MDVLTCCDGTQKEPLTPARDKKIYQIKYSERASTLMSPSSCFNTFPASNLLWNRKTNAGICQRCRLTWTHKFPQTHQSCSAVGDFAHPSQDAPPQSSRNLSFKVLTREISSGDLDLPSAATPLSSTVCLCCSPWGRDNRAIAPALRCKYAPPPEQTTSDDKGMQGCTESEEARLRSESGSGDGGRARRMENKDRKVERREANRGSVREKHQQPDLLNGNRAILIELLILEHSAAYFISFVHRSRDRLTCLSGSEIFPRDLNIDPRRHVTR